jgi:hypothetical protein
VNRNDVVRERRRHRRSSLRPRPRLERLFRRRDGAARRPPAAPAERGKLLGFNDQLSALTGAGLALLGGYALDVLGVAALAIGSTVLVLLPLIRLLRRDEAVGTIAPRRT